MILPIVAYGDPVLKKRGEDIKKNYPDLKGLINNMFETMYASNGVGLAAPQIGLPIRLFIIDAAAFADENDQENKEYNEMLVNFKRIIINPSILEESDNHWIFEEGCLSIPNIREEVERPEKIFVEYYDENFTLQQEWLEDLPARIFLHEYDHINGILFIDHLNALKRKFLQKKLQDISIGKVKVNYKMKFFKSSGK